MTAAKTGLRMERRAARSARPGAETAAAGRRLLGHLRTGLHERGTRSVAGYVPVGTEPGTDPDDALALPEALRSAGIELLLPLFQPDRDLDWAWYSGPGALVAGRYGLREPAPAAAVGRT